MWRALSTRCIEITVMHFFLLYSCTVFDNHYQAQYKRLLSNALLTDSCTATEAESLVVICITISICQRFFLLMYSKSYQEQNLSTNTITLNSQIISLSMHKYLTLLHYLHTSLNKINLTIANSVELMQSMQ